MFIKNVINSFDVIMVFFLNVFTIHNDFTKVMYNCSDLAYGPMWSSWVKSLYPPSQ